MTQPRRDHLLCWAFCLLPFLSFWSFGLFDLDEGIYAAVCDGMLRTGDWIIPRYAGSPWFEKPILLYWTTNPFIWAFGDTIGPRLGSVLSSIGTIAISGWFVGRLTDRSRGQGAMLVLAGTLLFAIVGNMLMTDNVLVLWFTASLISFYLSLTESPRWKIASGAALGLALLAKGPYVVVLFLVIALWTMVSEPAIRPARKKGWLSWFAGLVATGSLWYVPALIREPHHFVQEFVIRQNLQRFSGGDAAHQIPLWMHPIYYIAILGVLALPWWPFLRRSIRSIQKESDPRSLAGRMSFRWMVAVFVLFTISGTKLPHYILPLIPPMAILLSLSWPSDRLPNLLRTGKLMAVLCGIVIALVGNLYYRSSGQADAHAMVRFAVQENLPLATFQIDKRGDSSGLQMELDDIELPSLHFYSHSIVPDIEHIGIDPLPKLPFLMITRKGRMTDEVRRQFETLDLKITPHVMKTHTTKFECYEIDRSPK